MNSASSGMIERLAVFQHALQARQDRRPSLGDAVQDYAAFREILMLQVSFTSLPCGSITKVTRVGRSLRAASLKMWRKV